MPVSSEPSPLNEPVKNEAVTALDTDKDPVIWESLRDLYPLRIINSFAIIYAFFHCPKGS